MARDLRTRPRRRAPSSGRRAGQRALRTVVPPSIVCGEQHDSAPVSSLAIATTILFVVRNTSRIVVRPIHALIVAQPRTLPPRALAGLAVGDASSKPRLSVVTPARVVLPIECMLTALVCDSAGHDLRRTWGVHALPGECIPVGIERRTPTLRVCIVAGIGFAREPRAKGERPSRHQPRAIGESTDNRPLMSRPNVAQYAMPFACAKSTDTGPLYSVTHIADAPAVAVAHRSPRRRPRSVQTPA